MRFEIENELKKLEWFKERNGGKFSMDKDLKIYDRKMFHLNEKETMLNNEAEDIFNLECVPAIEDFIDKIMGELMTPEQLRIFNECNNIYIKTEAI